MTRERIAISLAVGVILAIIAGLRSPFGHQTALISILPPFRLTEGRLRDFPYKPLDYNHAHPKVEVDLRGVGRQAKRDLESRRTPLNLRQMALLRLLDNRPDEAVALLSEAARMAPKNSMVYNDLAVALMERSSYLNDPFDLIRSLRSIDISLKLDLSPEALFNKALVLEKLQLEQQSQLAWLLYLRLDSNSPWAREAKIHLVRLGDKKLGIPSQELITAVNSALQRQDSRELRVLVRQYPQAVRQYAEDSLFPAWAHAIRTHERSRENEVAASLASLGKELFDVEGDPLVLQASLSLRILPRERLANLAQGHLLYAMAKKKYDEREYVMARLIFRKAEAKLSACRTPFRYWATFNILACDYYLKSYRRGLALAALLHRDLRRTAYLNLKGRIDWARGLILLEQGDAGKAFEFFRGALAEFVGSGEVENEASLCSLLANSLSYLGDFERSRQYRFRGLSLGIRGGNHARFSVILGEAARAVAREGEPEVAVYFQSEALGLVSQSGDRLKISEALWRRSMILQEAGKMASAWRDLSSALENFDRIAERYRYPYLLAGMLLTKGAIQRQTQPELALASLNAAERLYRHSRYSYSIVDVLLERARTYFALGNLHRAEVDLLGAIRQFEEQADVLTQVDELQDFFLLRAQGVFDELIGLRVLRGDPIRAFELSERARSRGLAGSSSSREFGGRVSRSIDLLSGSKNEPLGVGVIQASLPDKTLILAYSVLDNDLITWKITRNEFAAHREPIPKADIQRLVESFCAALQASDVVKGRRLASELYDILVRPLVSASNANDLLVIIPDKALRMLPFAALRDRTRRMLLVEENPLIFAPSASLYVRRSRLAPRKGVLTALVVGNSTPSVRYSSLPTLPGSRGEISHIAALLPGSEILSGPNATISRLRSKIEDHPLLHYAGHFVSDYRRPSGSRLLLSSSSLDSGELRASTIARLELSRLQLVVLAGCSTAKGRFSDIRGAGDLAHAFLLAGVPNIIVALWPLNDRSAEVFWSTFYRQLKLDGDPAVALRSTQMTMIQQNANNPAVWAGYQLIGSRLRSGG